VDVSQRRDRTHEMARDGVTRSSGSFELLGGSILFGLLGWFVDGLVGTTPLFIVIGVVAGFVISTVSVLLQYKNRMTTESTARAEVASR